MINDGRIEPQSEWKTYQFQFPRVEFAPDVFRQVEVFHKFEYQGERVFEGAVCPYEWDDVPM